MTDHDKNRHDLTNQLSVIRGFADLLLADAADDDPRRGDLEEIRKAATAAFDAVARLFPASVRHDRRVHGHNLHGIRQPPHGDAGGTTDDDQAR